MSLNFTIALLTKPCSAHFLSLVLHVLICLACIYNCSVSFQLGSNRRNLCVELFIRAISRVATLLSYYLQESNEAKVMKCKSLLASIFLQLAKLFEDDVQVCREFVLTAFSLNPDENCYLRIVKLAAESGKVCTDDYGDFNCSCPQTPSFVLCDRCGHFSKQTVVGREFDALGSERLVGVPGYDPLSIECCLLEHKRLGLAPEVCDDLVNVVNNLRYKELSWCSDWQALSDSCLKYMEGYDPMHREAKELKHLKLRHELLEQRAFEIKMKLGRKLTAGVKLKLDRKFAVRTSCNLKKPRKQSYSKYNRVTLKNNFYVFSKETGPINFLRQSI